MFYNTSVESKRRLSTAALWDGAEKALSRINGKPWATGVDDVFSSLADGMPASRSSVNKAACLLNAMKEFEEYTAEIRARAAMAVQLADRPVTLEVADENNR